MLFSKQMFVVLGSIMLLQACTQIDDYMLGKDNTPKPSPLVELKSKVRLLQDWSIPIGKASTASTYLKLKPAINGNMVYVANSNGMVHAVNQKTGHLLWSKQLNYNIMSGPAVANGYIALGTNRANVILLRQSDGTIAHELTVSGDVLSTPVITHSKVIIKTIDGYLYAFDLKSGEKLWASEHGSPGLMLKASSSPVLMDKMVLVGFSDGKLDAIEATSGLLVWQRSIAYASGASDVERLVDIDADPIVRNKIVYLASYQGYVGALSLESGQFIWRKPASVYKNMAIDAHTLYLTDTDDVIWAMDRDNGQIKWKQPALKARGLTEPVLLGDHLMVGDRTGYLHVFSAEDGECTARIVLSGPVNISPSVSGHSVYVMTSNGQLSRFSVS
jgi:outer membrane protein assembly factor BamB